MAAATTTGRYAGWGQPELAAELLLRGLPQSGTTAERIRRLERWDAEHPEPAEPGEGDGGPEDLVGEIDSLLGDGADVVEPDTEPAEAHADDTEPGTDPEPPEAEAAPVAEQPTTLNRSPRHGQPLDDPTVFTVEFPSYGAPDDQSHQRMIAEVVEKAQTAGYRTRGGGRRLTTVVRDGQRYEVYGVSTRPQS